ncbi:MAG: M23 family metallopeptidase, partial [Desulfovibrionaceae bacterium]|nr:M23 family metallopeptidase [Desulfovibrionaceae bacterium]
RHMGADMRAAEGTPIRAAAAGRVLLAEDQYYGGNLVYIDHGQGLMTLYCHCSRLNVRPGDWVAAGQVIGLAGSTGRVTGPHLHLGVRLYGEMLNPLSLFLLR